MNLEEYISSGVLEAYVLGELSEKENLEVLNMAEKHPEVKAELDTIELTLEAAAQKTAIQPPSAVRDRLFGEELDETKDEPKVITMHEPESSSNGWKYAAAAAVTLAIVSSIMAYTYWNKWQNTESELTTLIAQNERVAEDYNKVNQQLEKIEEDLGIINNNEFNRIAMNGTDNAPGSMAYVYWNANSQEVYLSIQNLKSLTEEKQYQLWAIIDGTPVDAGVFSPGSDELMKMKNIAGAAAFAVTIEPAGGSENPTMETMQVMGAIEKG